MFLIVIACFYVGEWDILLFYLFTKIPHTLFCDIFKTGIIPNKRKTDSYEETIIPSTTS